MYMDIPQAAAMIIDNRCRTPPRPRQCGSPLCPMPPRGKLEAPHSGTPCLQSTHPLRTTKHSLPPHNHPRSKKVLLVLAPHSPPVPHIELDILRQQKSQTAVQVGRARPIPHLLREPEPLEV